MSVYTLRPDVKPMGAGSVTSRLLDRSWACRKRAIQLNEQEVGRMKITRGILERNARREEQIIERKIQHQNKRLQKLKAYRNLLNTDYCVDNFHTLKPGFKRKEALSNPQSMERYIYETRIYHAGYSMQNLRRQLNARIVELDSDNLTHDAHQRIKERLKEINMPQLMPRDMSFTAMQLTYASFKQNRKEMVKLKSKKKLSGMNQHLNERE